MSQAEGTPPSPLFNLALEVVGGRGHGWVSPPHGLGRPTQKERAGCAGHENTAVMREE